MNDTSPPLDGYTIYDPIDPYENHAGPFFGRKKTACRSSRSRPKRVTATAMRSCTAAS